MRTFLGIDFSKASDPDDFFHESDCPCAECAEDRLAAGINMEMEAKKWNQ